MTTEPEHRPRATIGLVSGDAQIGYIHHFEPTSDRLDVKLPSKKADGSVEETLETFAPEQVSFVALHKGEVVERDEDKEYEEYCVHVPGDTRFVVTASPDDIDDRLGFYVYPISNYSWFARVFFFQHGINAVEDQAPIGSIMVDSGIIREIDVEEGLEEQAALRNTRLGQILVEQGAVSSEAVEDAVEDLGRQDTKVEEESEVDVDVDDERGRLRLGEVLVEATWRPSPRSRRPWTNNDVDEASDSVRFSSKWASSASATSHRRSPRSSTSTSSTSTSARSTRAPSRKSRWTWSNATG
jgi:hypothetical protein